MHSNLHTRGEPGIDWDTSNPSQSDVTKVYYSVIDSNRTSRSKPLHTHYVHVQL